MSDPSPRLGNLGVPVGCVLLLAGFFLPWLSFGALSGMEIAADREKAAMAIAVARPAHVSSAMGLRLLLFVPILALVTLMIEMTVPPGHPERLLARLGVLLAGGTLTLFFLYVGIVYAPYLAAGFWGSCMGAMFILVGGVFDAARRE